MELVQQKKMCCGCRTCEKICPQKAIHMEPDKCGFLYPIIDKRKCVDCGLCLKKCAFQSGYRTRKEFDPFYGYGARHKKEEGYMESRSGGAFVALSDWIINHGGVVYGAGFDEKEGFYKVVHKEAKTFEQRDEFRCSKYVQSDLGDVFPRIKEELEKGELVLFSGTGCQVGALYSYLGKDFENLYTIDIVCHGVPSPKMWKDFLKMREKEFHGKVEQVQFRDKKKYGWTPHYESIKINGKMQYSRIYGKLFSKGYYRPSCFCCVYTNQNRPGDITIADFWGHEKAIPGVWDDEKGISLVLVNNRHGMEWWKNSNQELEYIDCTGYPFRHTNMKRPTKKPETYENFWKDYQEKGFEMVVKKYADYQPENYWKKRISSLFKKEKKEK